MILLLHAWQAGSLAASGSSLSQVFFQGNNCMHAKTAVSILVTFISNSRAACWRQGQMLVVYCPASTNKFGMAAPISQQ